MFRRGVAPVTPDICSCGNCQFDQATMDPFYTHQYIELPRSKWTFCILYCKRGQCSCCGKTVKATIPYEYTTDYDPIVGYELSKNRRFFQGSALKHCFVRKRQLKHIYDCAFDDLIDSGSMSVPIATIPGRNGFGSDLFSLV